MKKQHNEELDRREALELLADMKRNGVRIPNGSKQTTTVVAWLTTHPETYGLEMVGGTGLNAGTLYPIVSRLVEAGLVTSTKRDSPFPKAPPRVYHSLSGTGRVFADAFLKVNGYKLQPARIVTHGLLPGPATAGGL